MSDHDRNTGEWPEITICRYEIDRLALDLADEPSERYLSIHSIRERLEMKAWAFGKEADAAEEQQKSAKLDAERRVWQGKALAWSAASDELRRLANWLSEPQSPPDRPGGD